MEILVKKLHFWIYERKQFGFVRNLFLSDAFIKKRNMTVCEVFSYSYMSGQDLMLL